MAEELEVTDIQDIPDVSQGRGSFKIFLLLLSLADGCRGEGVFPGAQDPGPLLSQATAEVLAEDAEGQ